VKREDFWFGVSGIVLGIGILLFIWVMIHAQTWVIVHYARWMGWL